MSKIQVETVFIMSEEKKIEYEKPLFEEAKGLLFPKEIWEKFNGERWCLSCSGCHGCR